MQSSRPGADKDLARRFRDENRAKENEQRNNNYDQEIEAEVCALVSKKDYAGATTKIINYFSDIGPVDSKYYTLNFGEGTGGNTELKSFKDDMAGKQITYAEMSFGKGTFDAFADNPKKFGELVRLIYHEVMHVEQFFGLNGKPLLRGDENRPEREFLANYYTIMNKTLPAASTVMTHYWIISTLTDTVKKADGSTYGNYYNRLPANKQKDYLPLKQTLEKLDKTLKF